MTATTTTGRRNRRADRSFEVIAVLLLGVATLGSAWCGYQASRWNGEENRWTARASAERVEASRLFSLATQEITYDSIIVAQYAEALAGDNEELLEFYRTALIRPVFLPVIEQWTEQVRAGEPAESLLENEDYIAERFARYEEANARAEAATVEAGESGEHADDFVLITVLFASALFFAGVTTSFRAPFARIFLIAAAGITIAYCASRLVDLPVA